MTNELDTWQDQAPVTTKGSSEFDAWLDGVPVVDNPGDDSASGTRRRVFWF